MQMNILYFSWMTVKSGASLFKSICVVCFKTLKIITHFALLFPFMGISHEDVSQNEIRLCIQRCLVWLYI